jgi:hypothetical protein
MISCFKVFSSDVLARVIFSFSVVISATVSSHRSDFQTKFTINQLFIASQKSCVVSEER